MRSRKVDGERLRTLREDAWLTQSELANMAGVSRQTIADMENARRPYPKGSTMKRVADVLKIEREDLLQTNGSASSPPEAGTLAARGLGHHPEANSTLFGSG